MQDGWDVRMSLGGLELRETQLRLSNWSSARCSSAAWPFRSSTVPQQRLIGRLD